MGKKEDILAGCEKAKNQDVSVACTDLADALQGVSGKAAADLLAKCQEGGVERGGVTVPAVHLIEVLGGPKPKAEK